MVSDFIRERLDFSHALIDEGRQAKEAFEQAVNILKNIKYRIHDPQLKQKIKEFEQTHDDTLQMRINEIKQKSADPMIEGRDIHFQQGVYAKSYLEFYDEIAKQADI